MGSNDKQELIIMLLLENNCFNNIQFSDYIKKHYNSDKFNKRYKELLDKFLEPYALKYAEKSEQNL
jgi:hypothetical protein